MGAEGTVLSLKREKDSVEVQCGALRVRSKLGDLFAISPPPAVQKTKKRSKDEKVQVVKNLSPRPLPSLECNVIGLTVQEALPEAEAFIDGAVLSGLSEVRIVHGMGTGKLRAGIHEFLRKHPHVEGFRLGKYGEGESGVTVVTLK